jgi:hypothetical protein
MKKTYIKPETTVVALNVRDNVLQAGSINEVSGLGGFEGKGGNSSTGGVTEAEGREIIRSQDPWEEW